MQQRTEKRFTDGDEVHAAAIEGVSEGLDIDFSVVLQRSHRTGRKSSTLADKIQVTLVAIGSKVCEVNLAGLHLQGPVQMTLLGIVGSRRAKPVHAIIRSNHIEAIPCLRIAALVSVGDHKFGLFSVGRSVETTVSEIEPLLVVLLFKFSVDVVFHVDVNLAAHNANKLNVTTIKAIRYNNCVSHCVDLSPKRCDPRSEVKPRAGAVKGHVHYK